MNIFSFRAECLHDVWQLQHHLEYYGIPYQIQVFPLPLQGRDGPIFTPDVKAELLVDCTAFTLDQIVLSIEDTHILFQSLRQVPLTMNSLDRDHDRHGDD